MKTSSKLIFILLFLLATVAAFAQTKDYAQDDTPFEILILGVMAIFACAVMGAAIIGAAAATMVLFFIFGLITIGVLSTSVAIGLYKKSFSAGFRSFLMILFGGGCALIGGSGAFLVDHFFDVSLSTGTCFFVGVVGGLIGGILMAIATVKIFQWLIKILSLKFQAS